MARIVTDLPGPVNSIGHRPLGIGHRPSDIGHPGFANKMRPMGV
jgi:hypothetical protein